MTTGSITATTPTPGTLIEAVYETPDYRDAFTVPCPSDMSLETFATKFFLAQPRWLARVSMNLGDGESRLNQIRDSDFEQDSSIGSWRVHGRAKNEIVFGEHMGFMEYRFSILRRSDGNFEAATSVQYLKRFGNIYFAIVKPFHRGFVKRALRNVAKLSADPLAVM